jgi:hypothetical protein
MKNITIFLTLILGTISSVQAQIPSYIPKDSLVGWWPLLNNLENSIKSTDSLSGPIGKYNIETIQDNKESIKRPIFQTCSDGPTGTNISGYSLIGSSVSKIIGANSATISFDIYIDTIVKSNHYFGFDNLFMARQRQGGYSQLMLGVASNTNKLRVHLEGGMPNGNKYTTKADLPSKKWTKITINWSTKQLNVYLDDKLDTSFTNVNIPTVKQIDPHYFVLGMGEGLGSSGCYSAFKNFSVWNRALNSNEIKAIYEAKNCSLKITQEPQDKGCFSGSTDFTLTTTDTTATYQWQTNQGTGWINLSNAGQYIAVTTDSLIVRNITNSNDGQLFRCVVSGVCGKDTTREVKLSVWGVSTNQTNNSKFRIHPNPVKNILTVEGLNNFSYTIETLTGQSILNGSTTENINTELLPTGVYILHISNQKVKFIKE